MLAVLDGGSDWQSTAPMIADKYPWISFMYCISHGCSKIIKGCFDEDITPELHELNEWISDAQHWFSTHACSAFIKEMAQPGERTAFVWPAITRFCGVLLKIKRFRSMRDLLRRVVNSGVYQEKRFKDDPFPAKINGADVWQLMDRAIAIMGPILLLCRLADGQKPVISKLYGTLLYVRKEIENIAAPYPAHSLEAKVLGVFLSRWEDLQSDIAKATYMLDPLFVNQSKGAAECTIKLWKLVRKVSTTLNLKLTILCIINNSNHAH